MVTIGELHIPYQATGATYTQKLYIMRDVMTKKYLTMVPVLAYPKVKNKILGKAEINYSFTRFCFSKIHRIRSFVAENSS